MNIIYLPKDKLPVVNIAEIEYVDFEKIFSSMKEGCIFVLDQDNRLGGYINDAIYKKQLHKKAITINKHYKAIVSDSDSDIIGSEAVLKEDSTLDLLAVVGRDGSFKGAFVRTYPEELVSYDKLMAQVAIASLPAFIDEFLEYLKDLGINDILLAGDKADCSAIIKNIASAFSVSLYGGYDQTLDHKGTLIIDLLYSKSYRNREFSQWSNVIITKLDDILAASMVDSLLNYIRSRGTQIVFIEGPLKEKLRNAQSRWPSMFDNRSLANSIEDKVLLNDFCNGKKDLVDWIQDPENGALAGARITTNGIHLLTADYVGDKCVCLDGVRVNNRSTEGCIPSIHMYGPCLTFGSCVPDCYTIQHYLHELLDANQIQYNILNHGVKNGHSSLNDFLYILNTELKYGDIVVCLNVYPSIVAEKISSQKVIHSSSDYLNSIDDSGMKYLDMSFHVNSVVNQYLSQYIFKILHYDLKKKISNSANRHFPSYFLETEKISRIESSAILSKGLLRSYTQYLRANKLETPANAVVGSVLITANPVTKGHEYLIAHAKQNCDILYIFIVEEDKFYFSTAERMMLVKEVVNDPNIAILTTGTLMTAKFTFPEYFTKDKANFQESANQMPELHFQIFGSVVAPILGITKRFVGTEVAGSVTDIYNQKLMRHLPLYGIEVEVINRLEREDGVEVSASDARHMIEAGEFDKLKLNLPEAVVEYIKKNGENSNPT